MTPQIPTSDPQLGLQLSTGVGWRGQEEWGRWTLGKTSVLHGDSLKQQWVGLKLQLRLPYQGQRVRVTLEGKDLLAVTAPRPDFIYQLQLPALLPAGKHVIGLETNKSNRSGPQTPFAPLDPSDMGIGISEFSFEPVQVFQNDMRELYGILSGNSFRAVPMGKVTAFLQGGIDQQLHFRVISPTAQTLTLKLDGETVRTYAMKGGLLLNERLNLKLPAGDLHRLELQSQQSALLGEPVPSSIEVLGNELGKAPLYLQTLQLTQKNLVLEAAQLPAAGLLAALLTWGLYRWLSPGHETGRRGQE